MSSPLAEAIVTVAADDRLLRSQMSSIRSYVRQQADTMSAVLGAIGFGGLLRGAAQLDQEMLRVRSNMVATSGESEQLDKDWEMLNNTAVRLGLTTLHSATQAAEAMKEFAQLGFDAQQTMQAIPSVLNLASAGSLKMGEAASIAGAAIQQFGLRAADAERVVDVLAAGQAKAAATIKDFGVAMSYAGAGAHLLGVSIEETTAGMALLTNAGIKASRAGTGLNAIFSRLARAESKGQLAEYGIVITDTQNRLLSLGDIVDDFRAKLSHLSPLAQTAYLNRVFEERGATVMKALMQQGGGAVRQLTTELVRSGGTAEKMRQVMESGLSGAITRVTSAVGTMTAEVGRRFSLVAAAGALVGGLGLNFLAASEGAKQLTASVVELGAALTAVRVILPRVIGLGAVLAGTLTAPITLAVSAARSLAAGMSVVAGGIKSVLQLAVSAAGFVADAVLGLAAAAGKAAGLAYSIGAAFVSMGGWAVAALVEVKSLVFGLVSQLWKMSSALANVGARVATALLELGLSLAASIAGGLAAVIPMLIAAVLGAVMAFKLAVGAISIFIGVAVTATTAAFALGAAVYGLASLAASAAVAFAAVAGPIVAVTAAAFGLAAAAAGFAVGFAALTRLAAGLKLVSGVMAGLRDGEWASEIGRELERIKGIVDKIAGSMAGFSRLSEYWEENKAAAYDSLVSIRQWLARNMDDLRVYAAGVRFVFESVYGAAAAAYARVRAFVGAAVGGVGRAGVDPTVVEYAFARVVQIVQNGWKIATTLTERAWSTVSGIVSAAGRAVGLNAGDMTTALISVLEHVAWFTADVDSMFDYMGALASLWSNLLYDRVVWAFDAVVTYLKAGLAGLRAGFSTAWGNIGDDFHVAMVEAFGSLLTSFGMLMTLLLAMAYESGTKVWDAIWNGGGDDDGGKTLSFREKMLKEAKDGIEALQMAAGLVGGGVDTVTDAVRRAFDDEMAWNPVKPFEESDATAAARDAVGDVAFGFKIMDADAAGLAAAEDFIAGLKRRLGELDGEELWDAAGLAAAAPAGLAGDGGFGGVEEAPMPRDAGGGLMPPRAGQGNKSDFEFVGIAELSRKIQQGLGDENKEARERQNAENLGVIADRAVEQAAGIGRVADAVEELAEEMDRTAVWAA